MRTAQSQAYIYGIIAVLLWSTVATAFKLALTYLSPLQLMTIASGVSVIALATILFFQRKLHLCIHYIRSHFFYYLFLGMLNPFAYYLILFKAYDLLPAQQAQPLNYTWAITLSLLAVPLLGHKLNRYDLGAMLLGYLGVVVIAIQGHSLTHQSIHITGIILALLSTFLWALYWILNQRRPDEPLVGLLCGFLLSLPFTIGLCALTTPTWSLTWQGLMGGVYVGLFEMGLTFACWVMALKKTNKTSRIANLIFISPFLSLYFISTFVGETIHPMTYTGLILIMVDLAVQQFGQDKTTISTTD